MLSKRFLGYKVLEKAIRSQYRCFSRQGLDPDGFRDVVKDLGNMNENIRSNSEKQIVIPHLRTNVADFAFKNNNFQKPYDMDDYYFPEGWDWDSYTEWHCAFIIALFMSIFWGPAYLNRC